MSGSGGGGGWVVDEPIACERLQFETEVRSPHPATITAVNVGDRLEVSLDAAGLAIVLSLRGQPVGGIVSPQASRLRECIRGGTVYIASVIAKPADNIAQVRITPAYL